MGVRKASTKMYIYNIYKDFAIDFNLPVHVEYDVIPLNRKPEISNARNLV